MNQDTVVHAPFKRAAIYELTKKLVDTVYEYADRVSLAEAVGAIEIVKFQLMKEQENE